MEEKLITETIKVTSEPKLEDLKPIKGVSVDLNKYDKKEVVIESAEIVQVNSQFVESNLQWVLKVSSEVLESLGEGDDKIDFRASELFNLVQDAQGILKGFPNNEKSNLYKFMKDLKVSDPKDLLGKKALVKAYEKDGKTYLKFRY